MINNVNIAKRFAQTPELGCFSLVLKHFLLKIFNLKLKFEILQNALCNCLTQLVTLLITKLLSRFCSRISR